MAITRNNFNAKATGDLEGVDIQYFTVDFIADMAAEIGDPSSGSTVAGFALVRQAIENLGMNILSEGPTGNSGTEVTYGVRVDSIGDLTTGTVIRDAIRAVDTAGRAAGATPRNTVDFSAGTVTMKTLTIAL